MWHCVAPWDDHKEQQQQGSGTSQSLYEKMRVLQRAESETRPKPFGGAHKIMSESQTLVFEVMYTVGVWFSFDLTMTVSWFFPLDVRGYLLLNK